MSIDIENKRVELADLCRNRKVRRLELFGSASSGAFRPGESDLDFLVEFDPMTPSDHAECYFGLLEDLEKLFECPIDLVETESLKNPFFILAIEPFREVVYAA
jgi:uncharacterized protein